MTQLQHPTDAQVIELAKMIVKGHGCKWIEFEEIDPDPNAPGRKQQDFHYSVRLDSQDAARTVLQAILRGRIDIDALRRGAALTGKDGSATS